MGNFRLFSTVCFLLISVFFAVTPARSIAAGTQSANIASCGDFLTLLGKKPAHVNFDQCTAEPALQGKPLRVRYTVAGSSAIQAEAALGKSVGLKKLKKSCCQWDSAPQSFRSAAGQFYIISMSSEETTVSTRSQWRKIARFTITVDLITEEI